jgi:hypothetical protein
MGECSSKLATEIEVYVVGFRLAEELIEFSVLFAPQLSGLAWEFRWPKGSRVQSQP